MHIRIKVCCTTVILYMKRLVKRQKEQSSNLAESPLNLENCLCIDSSLSDFWFILYCTNLTHVTVEQNCLKFAKNFLAQEEIPVLVAHVRKVLLKIYTGLIYCYTFWGGIITIAKNSSHHFCLALQYWLRLKNYLYDNKLRNKCSNLLFNWPSIS